MPFSLFVCFKVKYREYKILICFDFDVYIRRIFERQKKNNQKILIKVTQQGKKNSLFFFNNFLGSTGI